MSRSTCTLLFWLMVKHKKLLSVVLQTYWSVFYYHSLLLFITHGDVGVGVLGRAVSGCVRDVCISVVMDLSLPSSHRTWTQRQEQRSTCVDEPTLSGSVIINNNWIIVSGDADRQTSPSELVSTLLFLLLFLPLSFIFHILWNLQRSRNGTQTPSLCIRRRRSSRIIMRQETGSRWAGLWVSWWQDWTGMRNQNPPRWR